jgi:hypothetical protein
MIFESMAAQLGFRLPSALIRLLADRRTSYGNDLNDWKLHWRSYMLKAQPILSCVYDLEWISPEKASQIVENWLNPTYQNGRWFLPFAQTGAGDAYCLTPTAAGEIGVGLIWHDQATGAIESASFESFVFTKLVECAVDLDHLLDDFSPEEARQMLIANVEMMASYLAEDLNEALQVLIAQVTALESMPDAAQTALGVLPAFEQERFSIVPRWECRGH